MSHGCRPNGKKLSAALGGGRRPSPLIAIKKLFAQKSARNIVKIALHGIFITLKYVEYLRFPLDFYLK